MQSLQKENCFVNRSKNMLRYKNLPGEDDEWIMREMGLTNLTQHFVQQMN
jgi:hypothetical protein